MTKNIGFGVVLSLVSALAACGGATPEAQEPEHVVAEERAADAKDSTEASTVRAEDAADEAEGNAAAADESADKAEESADESKK